ncbi:RNA-directed DNA polymerase, eukaryota, reverse transcriptase zinc-binding domain protein [Tanacetum coccineum]
MTRLELFRIKSMWGNYAFDYACSMARGLSGGLISIWDPNMFSKNSIWCDDSFIIIKRNWKNVVGDCFMVNIYGPQDHVSKLALWNRLTDFMHHHNGSYIMFGDMNAVRNAQERFGTTLNSIEADHFNSFIDSTGLVDLPIGGRSFTWMNKAGTKLSKLDRFLISEDVTIRLPDVRITALDRIDGDPLMAFDNDHRLILLQEIEKIDKFASMDIIQKAHVKWDIEGDENSKFFHGLINQKRRNQMINEIMVEGNWITNPCLIKDAFLQFYKRKFQAQDSQVTPEKLRSRWDCGSSNSSGPMVTPFAFVKEVLGALFRRIYLILLILILCLLYVMPNGANSSFSPYPNRQGDTSLSPFLFNLGYGGLYIALRKAGRNDWNANVRIIIIRVLHVFYLASGLKINIHKSNIYGIGVNKDEVLSMASNAGCMAGDVPFNYLGLPIGSNMKSIASWKTLVDRFHMRLSSWKANLLSIGGRLTLIIVRAWSSKLIMVKKEVSIQMVVASRAFGAKHVGTSIFFTRKIEAPHMHKAHKKRRALRFRALSLGTPRKGDGF